MPNVLDFVEPGPLLSDEVLKPPIVSKATVQRCISKLSPYWSDEQLDQVVEMFQAHGLLFHLFGKGSKARTVRASSDTLQFFYALGRGEADSYVFPSPRGQGHLTR